MVWPYHEDQSCTLSSDGHAKKCSPTPTGRGNDITKGRRRDQGAVKISCARQDPNARNCHGYRKFVKRSVLEDPIRGLLANDTLVIKYTIELVVSTGGALSKHPPNPVAKVRCCLCPITV